LTKEFAATGETCPACGQPIRSELAVNARVTVFGTGYLGAAHAACLAEMGCQVLGVDTDSRHTEALARGEPPFFEPGLGDLIRRGLAAGRLAFTSSYARAAAFGEVHFLCVGTPLLPGGNGLDLSQLRACVAALAPLLREPCLVVGKSTVPVGTAAVLAGDLARLAPVGEAADLAWNPEFLREGHAVEDTLHPDRVVVGLRSAHAERVLRAVYAPQLARGMPFFVTDLATAELAKVAANSFLATKISFINAIAEVCEASGADVVPLAEILGADPRIGPASLVPGLGFGGACLPKDILGFVARAGELGVPHALGLLQEVAAVNARCRDRVVGLAADMLGGSVAGRAVGVLGAAFKPGSDDVRGSPALAVAARAHELGAHVTVYDPVAIGKARSVCPELEYAASAVGAAADAEVLLLVTEWPEFADADPEVLGKAVAHRNVVDARHALDPGAWRAAGWRYGAPGRPRVGSGERYHRRLRRVVISLC
jgi:nucleotide sugar dehydrogenase